jgi:adenosylcobinamide kinase/adenosylcobinamide-phosphate guanylyltransferase
MPMPVADRFCLSPVTLILGGARSGKSRYAERLVENAASKGTYCATAEAGDAEMAEATPHRPMLVDCLTLWLSNLLMADGPLDRETGELFRALRNVAGPVVLVANEVGMGLVPETPLGRKFRDAAGRLNQEVAALADRVVFVAAGLPLVLKER